MADRGFPILFTGREIDFAIPKFTEMSRAADNLQKKLQIEQADQSDLMKEFRKNMDIDLGTFVSNYAAEQSADMAKAFTDKYTLKVKEAGGKIDNNLLMDMQKDMNAMKARQAQWQQSQALWESDKKLIEQRGGDALYDMEKFGADTEEFMRTGVYRPNSLEYSGVDMTAFFEASKWVGSSSSATQDVVTKNGKDIVTTTTISATNPREAKDYIARTLLSNPRHIKGAINQFTNLPDEIKIKYLRDYNNDGKITADDMGNVDLNNMNILENPVFQWAMSEDGFLGNVMKKRTVTEEMPKQKVVTKGAAGDVSTANIEYDDNGRKVKLTLKGPRAEAYLAEYEKKKKEEADQKTQALDSEASPWGSYTPPEIEDNKFVFNDLEAGHFAFDKKAEGIDVRGESVRIKKFIDKHSAGSKKLAISEIRPDGVIVFEADDSATIEVNIKSVLNSDKIRSLKVNTENGVKTIDEVLTGVKTATEKMRELAGE